MKVMVIVGIAFLCHPALHAQNVRCPFDDRSLHFAGSETEQAKCLLRPVAPFAQIGPKLTELPPPFGDLVGKPIAIGKAAFRSFLQQKGIKESEIGGSLDQPLARANNNDKNSPAAAYFVVHDTSTPNFKSAPFPAIVNSPEWPFNDFSKYGRVAHVFVNRVGASTTKVDFQTPFRATKFELKVLGVKGKGLFLHVELVQPRRSSPRGASNNDALAPEPGFTEPQLDRLALIYTAASLRAGRWLTPAYHAVLDTGLSDGHDDPQAFDLALWATRLKALIESIPPSS